MMSYYLVDFENVKKDGLDGIHKLGKEDKVCIFYSKNADSITFDQHRRLIESKADIELCKVDVGSKNALDFQLATQLGYLIANQAADAYYIVSKDKGFEILSGYWKNRGVSVTLTADITGRSHDHETQELKEKLLHVLQCQLYDNVKASVLQANGFYEKASKRGRHPYNSQEAFCKEALDEAMAFFEEGDAVTRTFVPEMHHDS